MVIKIKEMPNSGEFKENRCRLERFEICRVDRCSEESMQDEEEVNINPFFSFCEIP